MRLKIDSGRKHGNSLLQNKVCGNVFMPGPGRGRCMGVSPGDAKALTVGFRIKFSSLHLLDVLRADIVRSGQTVAPGMLSEG